MTVAICGTPIVSAIDDSCTATWLLSDLHVPEHGGTVLHWLRELLQAAAHNRGTRVLVLGDLFDAYTGPKQLGVGAWRQVAELLRASTAAGVPVTILVGNRDFMLDGRFEHLTGARVVSGGLEFRLGTRRCLALHGDELLLRDLPYQRSKRWLRHPVTRWLLCNLPLMLALAAARRVRKRSIQMTQRGDQERFAPMRGAVDEVSAAAYELLVFGHIHQPARGRLPSGGEYCVLPAFDVAGVHLRTGPAGLRYHSLAGAELPDYPPRDFPP